MLMDDSGDANPDPFESGWCWSDEVKPTACAASCDGAHRHYDVSGTIGDPVGRG
jgi:hypothetical protein